MGGILVSNFETEYEKLNHTGRGCVLNLKAGMSRYTGSMVREREFNPEPSCRQ